MSTTTLRPTASPAYQPRSFRHASPFPAASSSASTSSSSAAAAAGSSRSSNSMTYPLPSRPASPMPPRETPRMGADRLSAVSSTSSAPSASTGEHHPAVRGSSLRNEVKASDSSRRRQRPGSMEKKTDQAGDKEVEEGEVKEVTQATKQSAKDLLRMLSSLPAPLPESLPPNFLPTPRPTPSPSPKASFATFARTMSTASPRSSSSRSSSLGKRRRSSSPGGGSALVGLGLSGAEQAVPSVSASKKSRMKGGVSMTPTTSTFGFSGKTVSPEMRRGQSGGKTPPVIEGKETWSKAKWASAAASYKARAILLKRHGDAHLRLAGAKPQFLHLPADPLLGLLSLTDAVLLWLYAYWCDEQAEGRVKMTPYRESQALRDFVKAEWEKWVRRGWSDYAGVEEEEREGLRDMGRGMIGLMYLIEAVVYYHLSAEQLHHLNRRSAQINANANAQTSSSGSTTMAPSQSLPGPTPQSQSQSTLPNHTSPSASAAEESPSNPSVGPSPHSASSSSAHPLEIPSEIMGLISTSTTQSSRASTNLLNSRHHLPLSLLRSKFPVTYDTAIHSELADESLPPPNDPLGAARKVDIDHLERFVWPIELGMCAPMAHLAIFGRGLVREVAETAGKEWETNLEAGA